MPEPIKLFYRNVPPKYFALMLLLCGVISVFFAPAVMSASAGVAEALPTPTPVKKPAASSGTNKATKAATPKPAANGNKTANAPKPAATPKPDQQKIIVNTTSARVRSEATTSSTEIRRMKLGTLLPLLETTPGAAPWYKVQLPAGSKAATGWMSSTVAGTFDAGKAEATYRQLALKNFKKTGMSFAESVEIYGFLSRVMPEIKTNETAAELGLKRLQALAAALDAIPVMKSDEQVYKDFTHAQEKNIVYSDPAGRWFVGADLYWDLNKKYSKTTLADEIAWAAARTILPGECEGYVVCYLYKLRQTDGEYLGRYPGGKHSAEALKNLYSFLQPIVADLKEKKIYTGPSDLSDRAEYNHQLAELRTIVSRLPLVDKDRTLRQISLMAEAYR